MSISNYCLLCHALSINVQYFERTSESLSLICRILLNRHFPDQTFQDIDKLAICLYDIIEQSVEKSMLHMMNGRGKAQTLRNKGNGTGNEKRKRLTQKAIVDTASELFARDGFGATSLDDIAAVLGATKGALYYHVKNKEEILRLIFLTVLTASEEPLQHIAEADLAPLEKLRSAVEHQAAVAADRSPAMIVFYREHPHLTGPFAKEIILRKKAYERYFAQIIEEGQMTGVFKLHVDPKIVSYGLLGMCNWMSEWYRPDGQFTHQQISTTFANMIVNGLSL
ncbi:MAG TPA: TetR/AcrR family transcriptional regulator [Ktedonobacteraceae bacterium]|nr:TetR/AcrR family transcriptional regulator [Ktedonobacteraceae bacterium]